MRYAIILMTFLLLIVLSIFPIENSDIHSHLKIGEWILQHQQPLLDFNPFLSADLPASGWKTWNAYQWLSRLIFYLLHSWGGPNALIIFKCLLLVLGFIFLFRIGLKKESYLINVLAMALTVITAQTRLVCLPELFSLFFICIYFYILQSYFKAPGRRIYLLAVLQILWVNTHIYFPLGIIMILSFILSGLHRDRRMYLVCGLSLLSCLVNPAGPAGMLAGFKLMSALRSRSNFANNILELRPLFSQIPQFSITPVLLFWTVTTLLGGLSFILNWRGAKFGQFALWLSLLMGAVLFRRLIGIFALVNMPVTVINLSAAGDKKNIGRCLEFLFFAGLCFLLALAPNRFFQDAPKVNLRTFGLGLSKLAYPRRAVDFIEKVDLVGNMFNGYETGGYISWRLFPQKRAFIDATVGIYGAELFDDYARAIRLQLLPDELAAKYDLNYFLLMHAYPDSQGLVANLFESDAWTLIYLDDISVIFIKNSPQNEPFIKSYRIDLRQRLKEIAPEPADSHLRYGDFFFNIGQMELAKIEYNRSIQLRPNQAWPHYRLGLIYYGQGDWEKAVSSFRQTLLLKPLSFESHYRLALAYARGGELKQAGREFKRALWLRPQDALTHYNLALVYALGPVPQKEKARIHLEKAKRRGLKIDPHLEPLFSD
jgi:tetratricopeptide (TPR) repeat protein